MTTGGFSLGLTRAVGAVDSGAIASVLSSFEPAYTCVLSPIIWPLRGHLAPSELFIRVNQSSDAAPWGGSIHVLS